MKFNKVLLALPIVILIMLCGCAAGYEFDRSNLINVTVADGEQYYLLKNNYQIERGDDLTTTVVFRNGYIPDGCSYENYEIKKISSGKYSLVLYGINYPEFIKLGETNGNEAIRYFANGGEYIGDKPVEGYITGKISKTHIRTNTDLGFNIKKNGYIQIGWNTRSDGLGEHVGIGSRITVNEDGVTELYAEWEKVTDKQYFLYTTQNDSAYLTDYIGTKQIEKLVLPDEIDGLPVLGVTSGFCTDVNVQNLVIPKTVKSVENGAFKNCTFKELFFFDSLSSISDESFENCSLGRMHINAASLPRYQSNTELSYFADAVDRLITLKDTKKIIFFSGCSFSYGLNSETVAQEVGNAFQIVNMGIIGGTNASFQFDIISHFTGKGDILIHAPEPASPYQLMADNSAEARMFVVTEGNYDLLSFADISAIKGFFTSFSVYCRNRMQLDADSYNGFSNAYNQFGDIIKPRDFVGENRAFTEDFSYTFKPDFINDESAELLYFYYGKLQAHGVKVAVSFSPINYHGLPSADVENRIWEQYYDNFEKCISKKYGIEIISSVTDYIFEGKYFYDTDYHLNDEGVKLRTERLLRDMKEHGLYGGKL